MIEILIKCAALIAFCAPIGFLMLRTRRASIQRMRDDNLKQSTRIAENRQNRAACDDDARFQRVLHQVHWNGSSETVK